MDHKLFMQRALALAGNGAGWVSPNPQVGCVIVRDNEVIGEGWHTKYGEPHAEREALTDCARKGFDPSGATAYVTLEPCCHQGKQPPCTEALIASGISQVVMGSFDPNPLVSGKGIQQLREAGITVIEDVMREECDKLNESWLHFINTGMPYVTMKYAMTLDGKIATATGDSKWVTGAEARQRVHEDRAKASAILVGIGTVLADDPMLTARPEGAEDPHQPARFVLDAQLRTPEDSNLALTAYDYPTYIICEPDAPYSRREALKDMGCKIWTVPSSEGKLDLLEVFKMMGEKGFESVIVEGGGTIHGSLLATGCIKKVQAYVAPKIVGGANALSPVEGTGIPVMEFALPLKDVGVEKLGDDLLIQGYTFDGEGEVE